MCQDISSCKMNAPQTTTTRRMIPTFSGKDADYVQYQQDRDSYLAETMATNVKQLIGLTDDDYRLQACANPTVWAPQNFAHAQCGICYVAADGSLHHVVPDISAEGKERQKREATDMRVGTAIINSCAEGTASWLTTVQADEGEGSKIICRLDEHYALAATYAWDKYQKKLMSITLEPNLGRIDTLQRWQCDVMKVYQQMEVLAAANPATLGPLLQNEQLLVTLIRDNAPRRQKEASHWRDTRNLRTLSGFFKAQIEFDQHDDSEDATEEPERGNVMATITKQFGSKYAAVMAMVMATMSPGGGDTGKEEDGIPGKNGLSKDGKVIRCWTKECGSKDHHRHECKHPEANKKRERDANSQQQNPRGNQRFRNNNNNNNHHSNNNSNTNDTRPLCRFYPSGRCHAGSNCRFKHVQQQAAAATWQGHQQQQYQPPHAGPPPLPPSGQQQTYQQAQGDTPPADYTTTDGVFTAQGNMRGETTRENGSRATSARWNGNSWVYTYGVIAAALLCFVTASAAAAPIRAQQFENLTDFGPASSVVLSGENTGDRIPGGYWSETVQDTWQGMHVRDGEMTRPAGKKLYVGQTMSARDASGCYHVNSDGSSAQQEDEWLWDSGANVSVCTDRARFKHFRGTKSIKGVQDASGRAHEVRGLGECWIEVKCLKGPRVLRIERVLYVPTFALNIVSESWARSAGFGYKAFPRRMGASRVRAYDGNSKIHEEFKLRERNGLNYVTGTTTTTLTSQVLNKNETMVNVAKMADYKSKHCNLATAPTFKEFKRRVEGTDDTEVLTNLLGEQDDEGFEESVPKLNAPMRVQVRLRLADLLVLTSDDPAHSKFFKLHHMLGHGGMLETARVAKQLGIKLPMIEDRFCDACVRANLTRRARSKIIHNRDHLKPYAKVYTDIEGPFPERSLWNGYKYLIGFIDAKSHEGIIYGMHNLDQVREKTVEYLNYVRGQKIKYEIGLETVRFGTLDPVSYTTLQADSHSVYRSEKFKQTMLRLFQVKIQHSPPHDQSRNGMIERFWRTLGCRARAIMFAQNLPNGYWYWAYQHAARCHQVIGTSANENNKSPYEVVTGVPPIEEIKKLRPFGADCYVWEPTPGKLGEHGRKGKLIGWCQSSISHIVYFPKEKFRPQSIRRSRHIAIRDGKLPDAVLKGEIGMIYPEFEPFSPEDSIEVDVVSDAKSKVVEQGSTTTPKEAVQKDGGVPTPKPVQENGGVPTPRPVQENGGVPTPNPVVQTSGGVLTPMINTEQHGQQQVTVQPEHEDGETYSDEDTMMMTDMEPEDVGRAPPVQDTERRMTYRELPKRVRVPNVKFNDNSLNERRKLKPRRSTTRAPMAEPDEEELFISAAKAEQLVFRACLPDSTKKTSFPIGKVHFDCRVALKSEYGTGFEESIKCELKSIKTHDVMEEVLMCDVPPDTKIFNSYMLCHRKSLGGDKWKCKSRLVFDGSNTIPGVHTQDLDISTDLPRWGPVRQMIAAAKGKGWWVWAGDVKTAFLKGKRSKIKVYMHMPMGMRKYRRLADGRSMEIVQEVGGNLYGKVSLMCASSTYANARRECAGEW